MAHTNPIITSTEMSHSLSDILNKVYYQGETFEIKRGKEIVAKISPVIASAKKKAMKLSELGDFLKSLPPLDPEDRANFVKDLQAIRKSMPYEGSKWED